MSVYGVIPDLNLLARRLFEQNRVSEELKVELVAPASSFRGQATMTLYRLIHKLVEKHSGIHIEVTLVWVPGGNLMTCYSLPRDWARANADVLFQLQQFVGVPEGPQWWLLEEHCNPPRRLRDSPPLAHLNGRSLDRGMLDALLANVTPLPLTHYHDQQLQPVRDRIVEYEKTLKRMPKDPKWEAVRQRKQTALEKVRNIERRMVAAYGVLDYSLSPASGGA